MEHLNKALKRALPDVLSEKLGDRTSECARHGKYVSRGERYLLTNPPREIWTGCPECEKERKEEEGNSAARAKQQLELRKLEEALHQTALPARFIGRTFDNYKIECESQQKAVAMCRRYAENFPEVLRRGSCLILSGLPGTGKSHIAGAILQAILPKHVGIYVTMMDLIRMLRDTWRKDATQSESEILARLSEVPLLVIDEIGVQYNTDSERTLFFDVMDRRYRGCMPTILMTNQGKEAFKETIGERVYDRLTEVARWVPFDWPSYRVQMRREIQ